MVPFYETLSGRFHNLHQGILNNLQSLPDEALDWIPGQEMNSVSVIIVHLAGSERFLVGDVIMHDPSNRDRNAEFLSKGMTKADLTRRLENTEAYMKSAFEKLSLDDLAAERLHPREGTVSVAWALLHALDHAAEHTGHIEMTAQLWRQQANQKNI